MSAPEPARKISTESVYLDDWKDVDKELPHNIALVRAFNGRNVQKCYYDSDDKIWRNQRGEVVQVIKWKIAE